MNRIMKRMALPIGAAIVLGSSGFAFMASNSVAASYAGQGQSDIAGFSVSNISYHSDGGNFTYVNFDADPNGAHESSSDPAEAQIHFAGTGWYACTRNALNRANDPEAHFVCDLRGQGVAVTKEAMDVVVTH
jgi:hypothetical protein